MQLRKDSSVCGGTENLALTRGDVTKKQMVSSRRRHRMGSSGTSKDLPRMRRLRSPARLW